MFQLLLLGIFTVLFMNESKFSSLSLVFRFCNYCKDFNGMQCHTPMKQCWKFNLLLYNRSCTTDHFYFSDRVTGKHLYRYSALSCRPCEEGVFRVLHDLVRETYCCKHDNRCNGGSCLPEKSKIFGLEGKESIYDTEQVSYK
uniref:Uncharacterized protein n=1 Tax=Phocoena sinus TaxID=42100 RepID=A0A8C9BXF0_PHOSS